MAWMIWPVVIAATAGVIIRPWRLPEAVWAVAGAAILVLAGLLPWTKAARAIGRGTDVYLFLIGMMLLSEIARREGLFDWLAAFAVRHARGSARRLFLLIYGVGVLVTAFLSNDATAVVMTPAVFAAARHARAEPLPYLFVCAFIANAASFLLPISNPANLVLYGSHMPPLAAWLGRFLLPSLLAILGTYAMLRVTERRHLAGPVDSTIAQPALPPGGLVAAFGILGTALLLMAVSAADRPLGLPTAIAGGLTTALVLWRKRENPWATLRGVSWAVLPLVAGLFVLVEAVRRTGALAALAQWLHDAAGHSVAGTAWGAGAALAFLCNLTNNLPAGLIASGTIATGHLPRPVTDALLVGVDLGPNLSITGSLATILWLAAIRREGEDVTFRTFLGRGALVMPPALILALAGLLLGR